MTTVNNFAVFDVGGTEIKYSVSDVEGVESLNRSISSAGLNSHQVVELIEHTVFELAEQGHSFQGVALSLPGGVDVKQGIWKFGGAFDDVNHMPLKEHLETRLGLPVSIENDVNCVALGEAWIGGARGYQHVVCMTIGTGIGGGLILNGEVYRGSHFLAGEFGFMQTEGLKVNDIPSGSLNACAFGRMRREFARDHGVPMDQFSGERVFNRAEKGITPDAAYIDKLYNRLSLGLVNLISTLNPEIILVGGGVSQRPGLVGKLRDSTFSIAKSLNPMLVDGLEIRACELGNRAGRAGALKHWLNTFNH